MQAIAHNLTSQFTNRQLNITTGKKAKAVERLTTGYHINRSADDAAGLQISEKLRWQIRGLNKCDTNVQDGISLLQVADGALDEVTSIIHRLKELAVQGMNDTNTKSDVAAIQEEMDALLDEIDSIAERTTFNEIPLLQGEFERVTKKTITTDVDEQLVTQRYRTNSILPSWVKINGVAADSLTTASAKMVKNNSQVSANTSQRTDLVKYVSDPVDPSIITSESNWTAGLDNNYTGVIDFSSLAQVSGTTDYAINADMNGDGIIDANDTVSVNNIALVLEELVNTGFSMGCCTCSERYGIVFTTKERENELTELKSGYWQKEEYTKIYIEDLLAEANNTPPLSGADAAERLVQKVLDTAESKMSHFTHYTVDADNPMKLVVYDFRDDEQDTVGATIDTDFVITKTTEVTIPAHTVDYTYYEVQEGLMIQSGAEKDNAIALHLYDLTSGSTGLDLRNNIDLLKKNYIYSTSTQTQTKTYTVQDYKQDKVLVSPAFKGYDAHGEWVDVDAIYKTVLTPLTPRTVTKTENIQTKTLVGVDEEKNGTCLAYIDRALERLLNIRTSIGAQQNRLEHTKLIDNNTEENTQTAESRLRDAVMAEEMVELSKHNILEQAGQAMLAQANQSQQGILNLLQ